MANYVWKVTALRNVGNIAKGMSVEIVINGNTRKPMQSEVIEAINNKYGDKTAGGGLSMSIFDFTKS